MLQPGLMMDRPLLISSILEHAEAQHGQTQIVSRETHGPVFRYTFARVRGARQETRQRPLRLGTSRRRRGRRRSLGTITAT